MVDPLRGKRTIPHFFREAGISFAEFLGSVRDAHFQHLFVFNEGSMAEAQIPSHLVDRQSEQTDFVLGGLGDSGLVSSRRNPIDPGFEVLQRP